MNQETKEEPNTGQDDLSIEQTEDEKQNTEPELSPALPTEEIQQPAKGSHIHLTPAKKKILIAVTLVVVGIVGGGGYLLGHQTKNSQSSSQQNTTQTAKITEKPAAQAVTENTFLDSPKKLEDLKFYKNPDDYFGHECVNGETTNCSKPLVTSADIQYYQVGTTKAGEMIIAYYVPNGIDSQDHIAIKHSDNDYSLLTQQDSYLAYDLYKANPTVIAQNRTDILASLSSKVHLDEKTILPELSFPDTPTINGQQFARVTYQDNPWTQYLLVDSNPFHLSFNDSVLFGSEGGKTFYRTDKTVGKNFTVVTVSAALKQDYGTNYKINDPILNSIDSAQKITWNDGTQNQSIYYSNSGGCGTPNGYVIGKNVPTSQLVAVGTAQDGRTLYQLPASNALTQEVFTDDYNKGQDLDKADLKNLTVQQFLDKHGYALVKNNLNEYILLLRDDMFRRGGCGKPVVYLYPEQTTTVSVAVGADIKISTPLYPSGGWKNVLAQPNGTLTYQGKQYDSLFWEGYGHGEYPAVTSGTIVKRSDAVSTIRSQLGTLGLNQKESNDFLAYWTAKLPNTPYVRLTWFDNRQLDILAPLSITPQPQTTIRVFLDFEGLNQPINLPVQTLKHTDRKGFTAVEWGGLLREGIRN